MLSRPSSGPGRLYCFDWSLALYSCRCYWSLAGTVDHRSSFWSLLHKVQRSLSIYKRLVACYIFMRMLLVACLVDWLPPVMVAHHISWLRRPERWPGRLLCVLMKYLWSVAIVMPRGL